MRRSRQTRFIFTAFALAALLIASPAARADKDAPKVHDPIKIGNVTIDNRIARSSLAGITCGEFGDVSQQRINMEANFAAGGPGLIISSHVPIREDGRVLPNYATIHDDRLIEQWAKVVKAVEQNGSKYFMQLSHSGRQQDIGGVRNYSYADDRTDKTPLWRKALPFARKSPRVRPPSPGSVPDSFHGLKGRPMTTQEMKEMVQSFIQAAQRAAKAGVHGLELHSSNGYFFTQCISSAANDRKDRYGGDLEGRFTFWKEVIEGIKKDPIAGKLPLVVKLSVIEDGNALKPWAHKGNTLAESIQVAKMAEKAGADAIHVSAGDIFPHPRNPAGYLPTEMLRDTYPGLYTSGKFSKLNFKLLRAVPWALRLAWERRLRKELYGGSTLDYLRGKQPDVNGPKAGWRGVQGLLADSAHQIKKNVKTAKVLVTGGWQELAPIQEGLAKGHFDMITSARTFMANMDLPKQLVAASKRGDKNYTPKSPCDACNRCLVAAPKHPVMCMSAQRFGGDVKAMQDAGQRMYTQPPKRQTVRRLPVVQKH